MKKILFLLVLVPTIAFGIQPKNQNIDDVSTFKMMETNISESVMLQDTLSPSLETGSLMEENKRKFRKRAKWSKSASNIFLVNIGLLLLLAAISALSAMIAESIIFVFILTLIPLGIISLILGLLTIIAYNRITPDASDKKILKKSLIGAIVYAVFLLFSMLGTLLTLIIF